MTRYFIELMGCIYLELLHNYNIFMEELEFEWSPTKAESNEWKHGVSFEEAKSIFYDANARLIYDSEHSAQESRFILLGISNRFRLLTVSHLYKKRDRLIRLISARPATKQERKQYEDFLK